MVTQQRKAEAAKCQDTLRSVAKEGIIRFERGAPTCPGQLQHAEQARIVGQRLSGFAIEIEGHTDAEGTPERNLRLSERRAQSVVSYLTKADVPADRLRAIGYGETRPVAPNDTPDKPGPEEPAHRVRREGRVARHTAKQWNRGWLAKKAASRLEYEGTAASAGFDPRKASRLSSNGVRVQWTI